MSNYGTSNLNPKDFTKFSKSSSWGYYPVEVEQYVDDQDKLIVSLTNKLQESKQIINTLNGRIASLEDELRRMHMEMSSLELPNVEEAISSYVLNDFKNYNSTNSDESNSSKSYLETIKAIKSKTSNVDQENDQNMEITALNQNKNEYNENESATDENPGGNAFPFEIIEWQ